ncbi:unnamed protein product [Ilex paraguariensis]|uniref:ZF-HD dimerization-type domain-containing protein n=1 Tax=Ilex paraguariensis TaxID=185542 RepID=A0ABC8S5F4_9AQUA
MELRGQDKNIGMPSSKGCNPLQHNQDSSSSMLSSAPIISTLADRKENETVCGTDRKENETVCGSAILSLTQTLDHGHLHQHQHHLLNQPPPPPPRPPSPQRQGRDSNPDPDPDPAQLANATIASPSNCKTPQRPQQQPPPPPPQPATASSTNSLNPIRYRECLKNHAATMGGHIVDGCGEFMPSGEEGAPGALRCAACDCHRNFHRREIDGESPSRTTCYYTHNPSRNNSHRQRITIHPIQPPPSHPALPPNQHPHHGLITTPSTGPMMMAFGGGGGAPAESSSEDLNMYQSNAGAPPVVQPSFSISKKRFRTKFTSEQKDRMHEFAEKLGWKMQKQDEQEVQNFCNEVGVKRQVFKVWMHNNKQAMKKKQL